MKMKFKVGQKVRVKGSAFTTDRVSRIARITKNSTGLMIYILEDGGMVDDREVAAY